MDNREDVKRFLQQSIDVQKDTKEYARNYANELQSKLPSLSIRADNNQVTITMPYLQDYARRQGIKFIDMKQYFARSSKRKRKKNGGWYMVIPIGNKASDLKSASPRSMWESVSHSSSTVATAGFFLTGYNTRVSWCNWCRFINQRNFLCIRRKGSR